MLLCCAAHKAPSYEYFCCHTAFCTRLLSRWLSQPTSNTMLAIGALQGLTTTYVADFRHLCCRAG